MLGLDPTLEEDESALGIEFGKIDGFGSPHDAVRECRTFNVGFVFLTIKSVVDGNSEVDHFAVFSLSVEGIELDVVGRTTSENETVDFEWQGPPPWMNR
jgi:hypothetical protein